MRKLHYRVKFLTPAFLGNAAQSGQWRTPPFKALLRQWWRAVWAAKHGFPGDIKDMRLEEGRLFGNAWLDGDFRKSAVRLRLDKWSGGLETKDKWGRQETNGRSKVCHPEVRQPIGPLLYLGYGPLGTERVRGQAGRRDEYATTLKRNAAIQAGEFATLSVAAPAPALDDLRAALGMMNAYGTVGGRSRNGWGSLVIDPLDGTPSLNTALDARPEDDQDAGRRHLCVRPWREALGLNWPHAIGGDGDGTLVWLTKKSYGNWKDLMRDFAVLKIGLRTMFLFPNGGPPHPHPEPRHWLSYPITRHGTRAWDRNARLPNSLRFKVRPDPDNPAQLLGAAFHVPCLPPAEFKPDSHRNEIKAVWETIHQLLDELTSPPHERRYEMIEDRGRRDTLKTSLGHITLVRAPE